MAANKTNKSKEADWQLLGIAAGAVFRPSAPVDEQDLFAGRTEQMRRVADAVNQPGRHAVIFGERGVGKTSLVNVLSKNLRNQAGTLAALRINCDSADNYSSVWRKVVSQIEVLSETRHAGFGSDLRRLIPASLIEHIPGEIGPEEVRRLLTRLSVESVLVAIIDEFDRIDSAETRRLIADTIKTLSDQNVGATLVLVGVADSVDDLIAQHESTERAIVQIPMPRMSREELHEIMDKGLLRLGMSIEVEARDFISLLSQGLPSYTHLIALHASRTAIDAHTKRITTSHVESAIKGSLQDVEQSVRSMYDRAVASPRRQKTLYREVLLACALAERGDLGFFSAGDVRKPLQAITGTDYDIPNFAKHLKEFSESIRGPVLQRTGEKHRIRYRFTKPLMQPYLVMRGLAESRIDRASLERFSHWMPSSVL